MIVDLYKILNIKKNASDKTITKAFRKRVFETHPDREGDREEFELVHKAYKVLIDPLLRAEYDRTGQVPDVTKPKNGYVELLETLSECLTGCIEGLIVQGRDLKKTDLIATMKESIKTVQQSHKTALGVSQKKQKHYEGVLGRFSVVEEGMDNYFEHAIQYQLKNINAQIKFQEAVIAKHDKMIEVLSKMTYRYDKEFSFMDELIANTKRMREQAQAAEETNAARKGPLFLGTVNK